jgi:phage gp16-like protein
MTRRVPEAQRKAELAVIHAAAKEIGMADDVYRSMLARVTGLRSAKDMDDWQRQAVIDELRRLGARQSLRDADRAQFQRKFRGRPTSVSPEIKALIGKVGALLADSQREWAYAHGMAKRMFNSERAEWLRPDQIHKLIAALEIDKRRRGGADAR